MRFAGAASRLKAALIDWALGLLLPACLGGALLSNWSRAQLARSADHQAFYRGEVWGFANALFTAFLLVCLLGYFTLSWTRGQSIGMAMSDIRMVAARTGRPPGLRRGVLRAVLSGGFGLAVIVPLFLLTGSFGFGPRPGLDDPETLLFGIILAVGVLNPIWMVFDPRRQTRQDKLAGVVVLSVDPPPRSGLEPSPPGEAPPESRQ